MITCRRASELISRGLDIDLPFHQRAVLGFHKLVCNKCRRFLQQLEAVDKSVEDFLALSLDGSIDVELSDEAKIRLKQVIGERVGDES